MVDRTTIVIAHRLSTIRAANLILMTDAGRVIESGTHSELIARRGSYARLVERQMTSVQSSQSTSNRGLLFASASRRRQVGPAV
jgi:ATP-binding cassette subfamily C protein CydCD